MNKKNDAQVIINDRKYVLCGYESVEYLQRVASYINSKIADQKGQEAYRLLDNDTANVLLQINIADDYFRAKRQVEDLENESDSKSNEIFTLKHEIVSLQSRLDQLSAQVENLKKESIEEQKKVVKLETELAEARKKKKGE